VFGETAAATDILYAEKIGDDRLVYLVGAAAHEVHSYGELRINDDLITLSGADATGDWLNTLSVYRNLGTESQTALAITGSALPAVARGRGLAHYALDFRFGENKPKTADGIPSRITQVVKGAKVYDPRLDTTRGGTGAHRADNQSTWQFENGGDQLGGNWALIVAHYLLGYRINGQLVYGVGASPDDINWDQVAAMADVCDMTVDGKPKYRIGGILPITQEHQQVIESLESSVGGKVAKFGGKYFIWCPHDDLVPVDTIGEDDILRDAGVTFQPSGKIEDLYNSIRGRYIEPDTLYQPVPYPEITEPQALAEDGKRRLKEHDFPFIQDVEIAQRVALELVRRTRFTGTWQFAVGPLGLLYQPFDVLTLNLRETANQLQIVRVIDMQYSAGGAVVMTCIEEDSSIYDVSEPLGVPVTRLDTSLFDPAFKIPVTGLTAEAVTISGSAGSFTDAMRISWNDPGGFVQETQVRFRPSGQSPVADWQSVPPAAVGQTSAIIDRVESLTGYDIEVRHVNRAGAFGDFVQVQETAGGDVFPSDILANRLVVFDDLTDSEHRRDVDGNYTSSAIGPFNVFSHEHFLTMSFEARSTGDGTQRLDAFFEQRVNGGSWLGVEDAAAPPGTFFFVRNEANPPNGDGSPPTFTEFTRHYDEFTRAFHRRPLSSTGSG
jgi:hypothetical protein